MEMGKSGTHFELGENYPNPFNPRTVIRYTIPGGGGSRNYEEGRKTSLTVYDILGREVAVLVSEAKPPGRTKLCLMGTTWRAECMFTAYRAVSSYRRGRLR